MGNGERGMAGQERRDRDRGAAVMADRGGDLRRRWRAPVAAPAFAAAAIAVVLGPATVAGCSEADGGIDDPPAIAADSIPPPAAPHGPDAPRLDGIPLCPAGWHRPPGSTTGPRALCEPWPEDDDGECADPSFERFLGTDGCMRFGSECPADALPAGLPSGHPVIFVQTQATAGGDGSRTMPYRTIGEALAASVPGTIVAVGAGTYDEAIGVPSGVTIWGACAEGTRITSGPGRFDSGTVTISGTEVTVRNVTIGGDRPGIWNGPGTSVLLEDVRIDGTRFIGWVLGNARGEARRIVVRGTRADAGGVGGRGIDVEVGAVATIRQAIIDGNAAEGVFGHGIGTEIALDDVIVRDGRAIGVASSGGLWVQSAARLRGTRILLEDVEGVAAQATAEQSTIELEDAVIRRVTARTQDGESGVGAAAVRGGSIHLTRPRIAAARSEGIYVVAGALRAEELHVTGTHWDAGLLVTDGGTADLERIVFEENGQSGFLAMDADTLITAQDCVIQRTQPYPATGTGGWALHARSGATVLLERCLLDENLDTALTALDEGTLVTARDVTITNTLPEVADRTGGFGMAVMDGAEAVIERASLVRNRELGILASGAETRITAADLTIEDTLAHEGTGTYGGGMTIQLSAVIVGERLHMEGNRDTGLAVIHGASATLDDLSIQSTQQRVCADSGCADRPGGIGIGVAAATIAVRRFHLADGDLAGMVLIDSDFTSLSDGIIEGHPIGINVQGGQLDVRALVERRILLRNNERGIDSDVLPLPAAFVPPRTEPATTR